MSKKEMFPGAIVYHAQFPYYGHGVIEEVKPAATNTSARFLVRWYGSHPPEKNPEWCRAGDLHKRPAHEQRKRVGR